jgi:hypothetical protein
MEDKDISKIFDSMYFDTFIYSDYMDKIKDFSNFEFSNPDVIENFNKVMSKLLIERKEYKKQVVFSDEEKLRAERKQKLETIFDKKELV